MPTRRFENLDDERKRQILEAAADHFAEHGYEGASYNQIIAATGLSKGAIYYYFEDKSDLFATVVRLGLEDFGELPGEISPVGSAEAFWSQVEHMLESSLSYYEREPRALGVMRSLVGALAAGRDNPPALVAIWELLGDWTRRVVEVGQAVDAIRDDLPKPLLVMVAQAMLNTFDRWVVDQLGERELDAIRPIVPPFVAMLRRMAAPDGSG